MSSLRRSRRRLSMRPGTSGLSLSSHSSHHLNGVLESILRLETSGPSPAPVAPLEHPSRSHSSAKLGPKGIPPGTRTHSLAPTTMSRQALLSSAISFLRDPSTASSPLAQRVAFLESKGLTPSEIEQALQLATSPNLGPSGTMMTPRGTVGREFERDWRDWFIMTVVGGSVGYLAILLAQVSSPFLSPFVSLSRSHY